MAVEQGDRETLKKAITIIQKTDDGDEGREKWMNSKYI